jgi:hypothetical protein
VPWEIWLVMVILTMILFFHALLAKDNADITAILAVVFSGVTAWISGFIDFHSTEAVLMSTGDIAVIPTSYLSSPAWFSLIMLGIFLVSIILAWRNIYNQYLARRPEWKQARYK